VIIINRAKSLSKCGRHIFNVFLKTSRSLELLRRSLEQKRWCQKFAKHDNWGSKLGIHSQLKHLMQVPNLWKWSTKTCEPWRRNPLENVGTTWVSLMTTQRRRGFTSWNTKVKCFNIFWVSKQWWRRKKTWTSNS
jgi:hypothetical protein